MILGAISPFSKAYVTIRIMTETVHISTSMKNHFFFLYVVAFKRNHAEQIKNKEFPHTPK